MHFNEQKLFLELKLFWSITKNLDIQEVKEEPAISLQAYAHFKISIKSN